MVQEDYFGQYEPGEDEIAGTYNTPEEFIAALHEVVSGK